jgi:predicted RNA binding protein YcfA (HicA-like mRNA interferase family)
VVRLSSKTARELVAYAEALGYRWNGKLSGRSHIILRHPNGALVTISGTPTSNPNDIRTNKRLLEREVAKRDQQGGS